MKRITTITAAVALCVLAALSTATLAGAATAKSRSIAPVAALRAHTSSAKVHLDVHFGRLLLPKHQVAPKQPARKLLAALPASVDLSPYSPAVGYQGPIGSCVTWAIDYAMLGWYSIHDNVPGQPFNPMYTYSQIHLNNKRDGGGSYPIDALKVALTQGNDPMAHYSHSTTDFKDKPNADERANAANYKISGYQVLFSMRRGGGGTTGASMIQNALAAGKPVAISIPVRAGFVKMGHGTDALDNDNTSRIQGGHEVLAIGYDQLGLWIQNSWSTAWGKAGFGRLSWRVVASDVFEAETISGFATQPTPTPGPSNRPVISRPDERLGLGNVSEGIVPVDIYWSASDPSGIATFVVYLKQDAGAQNRVNLSSTTQTSQRLFLAAGHTYTVSVQAQDTAGRWAPAYVSKTFSVSIVDDASWSFGGWTRYPWGDAWGGSYLASQSAGSWFSYSERASDIGLLSVKFNGGGHPEISHDGHYDGTIDLSSSTPQGHQLVYWAHFADPSSLHSIKLVTASGWATVDGIVLIR
jgi:Papain family cysteine protease